MPKVKSIQPGGVDEYISACPSYVQESLKKIRSIILAIAPESIETVSYFQIPGYSYGNYDYNGMFVWFSFKEPFVRLHLRPPVIDNHKKQLAGYVTTKSIVSFSVEKDLPVGLVKDLVKASLNAMKDSVK
ncbi:MAG: DUF1801 domain-containing protein [Candidatus Saccharibacteria bacterium]